jgi:CBS domain-containing protein
MAALEVAMKAKDVMTRPVVSVEPGASVQDAVQLMLERRISGLPVIDKARRLVGIVTEGDFLRRTELGTERRRPRWLEFLMGPGRLADEYVRTHGRKVEEVMTRDPEAVPEDRQLVDIVQLMEKRQIKRVPVVRGDQVVGIISRANLLHALASTGGDTTSPKHDDDVIRERLLAELDKQRWAPIALINVIVRNGIVELWGTITDERQRHAIIVAAENISGVKDVRDHLVWIDPMSDMAFYPPDEKEPRRSAETSKRS